MSTLDNIRTHATGAGVLRALLYVLAAVPWLIGAVAGLLWTILLYARGAVVVGFHASSTIGDR